MEGETGDPTSPSPSNTYSAVLDKAHADTPPAVGGGGKELH
ncbi:hypothetical protein EAH_00048920, partial [Eimeria acervulina]